MRSSAAMCAAVLFVSLAAVDSVRAAENRRLVELILSRAILQRDQFLYCANRDNDRAFAELLVRGWKRDFEDFAIMLRENGYGEGYIRTLADRFSLGKAPPADAGRVCAMLGDWKTRWERSIRIVPILELIPPMEEQRR